MGRGKLLPNINNLLLQLHLPQRNNSSNANGTARDDHNDDRDTHHHHRDHEHHHNTDHQKHHHHHHHHHIFAWPYLKRKTTSSSHVVERIDHEDSATEPPTSQKSLEPTVSSTSSSSSSTQQRVSFGTCEVRIYAQVLGDHPCCSQGCPIQLGWNYKTEESFEMDEYETLHHHGDAVPLHELRLTPEERRNILILCMQRKHGNGGAKGKTIATVEGAVGGSDDGVPEPDSRCGSAGSPSRSAPALPQGDDNDDDYVEPPMSPVQHDRELRRECRRLHRCGGWNVNVQASRKRNRRDQRAFFGTTTAAAVSTLASARPRVMSEHAPESAASSRRNDHPSPVVHALSN
mmetsp:Transcript_7388/g.18064  ORF Transcript_7388/g.18064 Transcript_7388/m.18064 type:complete len:346 (-) Transcript_7388:34-1071(-)